jgi:hypothetical protein
MRRALIVLSVLLALAGHSAPPQYPVHRSPCPVTVDGDIAGDPAWAAIPCMQGFSVLGGGYSFSKQTVAQLCHDDEALYLAVTCEEPDAAELKPRIRDGGDTWAEDSLELFLQPPGSIQVYQLGITAAGARGSFEGGADPSGFQAAARIGEGQYTVEARIPFGLLKAAPTGTWRGNVCRNIFTTRSGGDKFTSWAPLQRQFLEPANFAYLTLMTTTLTPAEAAQATAKLSAPYRDSLARLIAEAAATGAQYVDTLKEAAGDATFGKRARELLGQWQAIDTMRREAQAAPVPDMRRALMSLQSLNAESYQVKYEYLISKLFADQ